MKPHLFLGIAGALLALTVAGIAAAAPLTQNAATPKEKVLYSFSGQADGSVPESDLIADANGALYGTAAFGGTIPCSVSNQGCGVVYKLTPSGKKYTLSVLYAFGGGSDGNHPVAGLVADAGGALYGTTSYGGSSSPCRDITQGTGCGTVFKLTPTASGYTETILHRFAGDPDGAYPLGDLIIDTSGALYGTTWLGGANNCHQLALTGCGTVFKLTPNGSNYTMSTIYKFGGGSKDGARPAAALLAAQDGSLFGTTEFGVGQGTVFKLTPSGSGYTETILFPFTNKNQGANPISALVADAAGTLYGTTNSGMKAPGCKVASREVGCGVVFKLTPSSSGYSETVVHQFVGGSADGWAPAAGVVIGKNGVLYGTTFAGGGSAGAGTVYALMPSGSGYSETILLSFHDTFQPNGGAFPNASLLIDRKGKLYGTTQNGGAHCESGGGCGVVFQIAPGKSSR